MKHLSLILITTISAISAPSIYAIPFQSNGQVQAPQQTPRDSQAAEHYYQEGLKLMTEGNLDAAKKAFSVSLDNSPDLPKAMLGLAEIAFKQKNQKEAENWINYAYDKAPNDPYVLTSHGRLAYLKQNYTVAENDFLRALKIDPNMTSAGMALGDLYFGVLRRPDRAISTYHKVLERAPEHAGAHYALGMSYLAINDNKNAEKELLAASKLSPDNPLPYFTLGDIAFSEKRTDEALTYYNHILSIDPDNIKTLGKRADTYQVLGKYEEAISDYSTILAIDNNQPAVYMKLGMLHQVRNDYAKSKQAYLSVIEYNPDAVLAYNNLAWMAAENNKDIKDAVRWANTAAKLAPDSAEIFDTLGWVYRAEKDYNSAAVAFKRATRLNPQSATAFYHLGLTYLDLQSKSLAKKAFKQAISLDNDAEVSRLASEALNSL